MKRILIFQILAFFLAACQSTKETRDYTADIERIENNLTPGLIIEGEEIVPSSISQRMAEYNVPGVSIAFFENGAIQWTRTYGYLSNDSLHRVDESTRFQAASISKPVAASAMLTLVEQGKLDLDADVNTYLREWKVPENKFTREEKVTLRRLVTHNAGLTVHGFRGYASDEEVPTTVQVLRGEGPTNSDPIVADTFPGAIWRYSGGGYTFMQRVVEETTGEPFPDFVQEAILAPAGMKRSTYEQPLPPDKRDNTAVGHRGNGEKVKGDWHTYPEMAAAGLWTTPSDLARWAIAMQNAYNGEENGVLAPATARAALTKHANDRGLGPGLLGAGDSLTFSHGGANEGYRCYLIAFAKPGGQGVAIMSNGDRGGAIYSEIVRSISQLYGWKRFEPAVKKVISLTEEEKTAYTGIFQANETHKVEIDLKGEQLMLTQFWNQAVIEILPEAPDRFFDRDGVSLNFTRDGNGEVNGFEVQGYTFSRVKE